ncbi:capsid protein [Enterococcus casseliflavus]|uniref:capsid protein n=1 Tax=Enterococcus casseliflavus TaxID=37734 RepID=UPI0022E0E4D6|nr:capsid protein [Enterococcus casseliflavus]
MPVILDSKDLAKIDKEFAAESQVWEVLTQGAKDITEEDFVGTHEVRVNEMQGFTAADYKRNKDNERNNISVEKSTLKLKKERWMGYDMDRLDQSENAAYQVGAVIEEHTRLVTIPEKDQTAVARLLEAGFDTSDNVYKGKTVKETITKSNILDSFDDAEAYMTDTEVIGQFVAFMSSDAYKALKNADGVSKTFTTNTVQFNGIDRRVEMLDGTNIIIQKVAKNRLQVDEDKHVNFIMTPITVAKPIEKYNTIDLVPADQDRGGYRDTIKGLDYYDCLVLKKARPAIYISYDDPKA